MRLLKNRESGQAMIMALILLALGSLIVVPTLNLASTNLRYHQMIQQNTQEIWAADSGVEYALCELGNDSGAFGPELLPSEINDRSVNVTVEDMGDDLYKIISTATSDDGSSTTIESYIRLLHYAIISTSDDGGVHVRHNSVTNGDVFYAGEFKQEDNAVVNGFITEGPPFDMGIDPEEYKAEAQSGDTHSGDLIINSSPYSLGPLYITGELKIESGMNVILAGTVYVEKNIEIKDDVTITGTGNLLCDNQSDEGKSIEIRKRVTISLDTIPVIMSVSNTKEIKIGDECDITGIIYAPEGKVHFHANGESHVYGALIAKVVKLCEDATVTYPQDLDLMGPYKLVILTWQVN